MTQNILYKKSNPLIAGSQYIFSAFLFSKTNSQDIKTTPTITSGDVKISKDGGAYSNISSLPVEVSTSGELTVTLSPSETSGVVRYINVKFSDVVGDEWCDAIYTLEPSVEEIINLDNLDVAISTRATQSSVWSNPTRTLTSSSGGGATAQEVWQYSTRSLTQSIVGATPKDIWEYKDRTLTSWKTLIVDVWKSVPSWIYDKLKVTTTSIIEIYRGVTNTKDFNSQYDISGASNIALTIKNSYSENDSDALLKVDLLSGLTVLNGVELSQANLAKVEIIKSTSPSLVRITIEEGATTSLKPVQERFFDLKARVGDKVYLIDSGKVNILPDITNVV
jgi:hypothetical protein